jgi:hypothetical protein
MNHSCVLANTSFTAVAIIDESTVVMTQNDDADAGESLFGIRYWIAHTHAHAHAHTHEFFGRTSHTLNWHITYYVNN